MKKKIIVFLITVFIVFMLCGCNNNNLNKAEELFNNGNYQECIEYIEDKKLTNDEALKLGKKAVICNELERRTNIDSIDTEVIRICASLYTPEDSLGINSKLVEYRDRIIIKAAQKRLMAKKPRYKNINDFYNETKQLSERLEKIYTPIPPEMEKQGIINNELICCSLKLGEEKIRIYTPTVKKIDDFLSYEPFDESNWIAEQEKYL